jgi:Mg2+ and Co2+ transporter CorA
MEIRTIVDGTAQVIPAGGLAQALADPAALVWVDIPHCDAEAQSLLADVFGFHPTAVRECVQRQRMPKFHAYVAHVFVVLHSPHLGEHGHVHYVELDQFVSARFLVTVHGPTNPAVPPEVPVRETDAVWERITAGRFRPRRALEISHAIVSAMAQAMEQTLETVTGDVWSLEQRVTGGQIGDPEPFLDEMFRTRHALMAVANMTGTALEVYERMRSVAHGLSDADQGLLADNVDQLLRVNRLAAGQREYLQGVIEFYRTQTDTKMAIAAERLAVIAVVTLPITALASVLGMNVIVNETTQYHWLALSLAVMMAMSAVLLLWAKRHGWW